MQKLGASLSPAFSSVLVGLPRRWCRFGASLQPTRVASDGSVSLRGLPKLFGNYGRVS